MHEIKGNTFKDVYKQALEMLLRKPDYVSAPRGKKVSECMDVALSIENPLVNLFTNSYRGIPLKYLRHEIALYLSGRTDAGAFTKFAKFWGSIANSDGTINSAYGHLIFNPDTPSGLSQFDWAFNSLLHDQDSRQAVMFYNRPQFQSAANKDFVCTLNNVFHIRGKRLFMRTNMRSNDIRRGMMFDIPFFMLVHWLMLKRLQASGIDVELGAYTHYAASLHLYHELVPGEHDTDLAEKMLAAEWGDSSFPLPATFDCVGSQAIADVANGTVIGHNDGPNADFINWLASANLPVESTKTH